MGERRGRTPTRLSSLLDQLWRSIPSSNQTFYQCQIQMRQGLRSKICPARTQDVNFIQRQRNPCHEKAQKLASQEVEDTYLGRETFLALSRKQITSALNVWANETLEQKWISSSGCCQAKDHVVGFHLSKLNSNRKLTVKSTLYKTGKSDYYT